MQGLTLNLPPHRVPHSRRSRGWVARSAKVGAPAICVVISTVILLRFPPDRYHFYPQCPIHALFGILCPGCGTTRALAALLHGNIAEALRLNALTTLLIPVAAAYAIAFYVRIFTNKPLPQPPPAAIYATLAIAAVFTLTRNL